MKKIISIISLIFLLIENTYQAHSKAEALTKQLSDSSLEINSEETNSELFDQASQKQVPLQDLLNSFKKYCLNASWITQESIELPINDFGIAWETIVNLLTKTRSRRFYFGDTVYQGEDWKKCTRQCKLYDDWLSILYVDLTAGELIEQHKGTKVPSYCISIFDYWQLTFKNKNKDKSDEPSYYQFYAFYLDCLTHLYDEYIEEVNECAHDKALCRAYWLLASTCLNKLEKIVIRLKNSENIGRYNRYQLAIKRLRSVAPIVEENKLLAGNKLLSRKG